MPKVSKDRIDQSILTDYQSNKRFITVTVMPHFDRVFEEVRQHNMDLYGAVGSRTIRNKKYEIHKKLLKYMDEGDDDTKVPPMLKTFLGFYYDIYTTQTSHIEEIQDYEEYSEVYDDITKHGNFDDVVFCTGIVYEIVDGLFGTNDSSYNVDNVIKVKNNLEKVNKVNRESISKQKEILRKYSKYVQINVDDYVRIKLGNGVSSYIKKLQKVDNILHEKNKVELRDCKGKTKKLRIIDIVL